MFTSLKLDSFKSFQEASLTLGPFSLLVGANASGKSNLRDAFRFLHGIGRGYSLADIIGERYGPGGESQWRGTRGGARELAFRKARVFGLQVEFSIQVEGRQREVTYEIRTGLNENGDVPLIRNESLHIQGYGGPVFSTHPNTVYLSREITTDLYLPTPKRTVEVKFHKRQPILSQALDDLRLPKDIIRAVLDTFASMRFFDPQPESMRQPSFPGQTVIGDRGENLSSVLQAICADPDQKQTLVQWLRELTPMDAVDFDFPTDQIGRVLVTLIEGDRQHTTAYSASDGTLRFLGILAALLGPDPARFYFFDELETGIHPARLHLLLQLVEQRVARGDVQVVATTHSPQLLGLVSKETLEHVSLIYRREGEASAQIRRLLDLPHAQEILSEESLARLHASGWLEDAVEFAESVASE